MVVQEVALTSIMTVLEQVHPVKEITEDQMVHMLDAVVVVLGRWAVTP